MPVENPADSAESMAKVASIAASLKQSLLQGGRAEGVTSAAAKSPSVPTSAPVGNARVLVYLEAEPSASELEFLLKMMSAIHVGEEDLVLEFGDFPETRVTKIALGIGLSKKKSARLFSWRPDRVELPALSAIQQDPALKRESWEKLKQLAARLKELG
jgi:hypothetical protein